MRLSNKIIGLYLTSFSEMVENHQARNQLGTPGGAKSFLRGAVI